MKAVILAGGLGSRLSEETVLKPKPMVEIGGMPVLWHIMKIYSHYGINDFVICLGYKGYIIKEYFANYFLHMSDITFNMQDNRMEVHEKKAEPWRVTLVDTGAETLTGGRLKRVQSYLDGGDFCFTYGDGVGDVDIAGLIELHRAEKRLATLTAVIPSERFGVLDLQANQVKEFKEKPKVNDVWVNGGFFVLSPKVLDYVAGDSTIWEQEPMRRLAREGQLSVFRHKGFWQPMDTLRDKQLLDLLWQSGQAPWKKW